MRSEPSSGSAPWSYAVRGLVGILVGLYMLLAPGLGLAAFVLVYGLFSLVDGVIAAAAAFLMTRGRGIDWALLLGGLVSIVVGLLFLFRPGLSIAAMSLLIAAWMILVGLSAVISEIRHRKQIRGEWLLVISGVFAAGFGLYLFVRPIVAVIFLPLMIGAYALFWGLLLLGGAVRLWRRKGASSAVA